MMISQPPTRGQSESAKTAPCQLPDSLLQVFIGPREMEQMRRRVEYISALKKREADRLVRLRGGR